MAEPVGQVSIKGRIENEDHVVPLALEVRMQKARNVWVKDAEFIVTTNTP